MKKKNILNLIKYYAEKNDIGFRTEAMEVAKYFSSVGDYQLAEYISALLSDANVFVPQTMEQRCNFLIKVEQSGEPLPLPDKIKNDVLGVVNAIGHNVGINKFLFHGAPGTGKTETVKHLARILGRELYIVDFNMLIDSKLGQTAKNIAMLFDDINGLRHPEKIIILFDEIDALALDRTNSNDIREMGRATSAVFKGMDGLNPNVVLIATTNLFKDFDRAMLRRFDSAIDFNRYTRDDLLEIAEILLSMFLTKFKFAGRNMRLFRKIMSLMEEMPYPGELKNMLKTAIAFSNPANQFDYLKRLYEFEGKRNTQNLKQLQADGFTVREIEVLTGVSKSQVARELKE